MPQPHNNLGWQAIRAWIGSVLPLVLLAAWGAGRPAYAAATPTVKVTDSADAVTLEAGDLTCQIQKAGFRFGFTSRDGRTRVAPHPISGLQFGPLVQQEPAAKTEYLGSRPDGAAFRIATASGRTAYVTLHLEEHHARFEVQPQPDFPALAVVLRVGTAAPGYGLGDNQIDTLTKDFGKPIPAGRGTEITGFSNDDTRSGGVYRRAISNFAIYPKHGFALINLDPLAKIVRSTTEEIAQGSRVAGRITDLHFFFGDPRRIYSEFLAVRNTRGYPFMAPRYEFFGVGWEAYGALGWDAREATIRQDVDKYLELGFPFSWMIIGSGFWPRSEPRFLATTSFGLWDPKFYPDHEGLLKHFRDQGLKIILGLRIAFIVEGPYSEEGRQKGYFIKEGGQAKVYKLGFPKSPAHLLDSQNPAAVRWYIDLCKKWGADGFKEDLFGYGTYTLRDDKLNPVNAALKEGGWLVMGRNTYAGSQSDLHRIEDFNYNQDQDRGPLNTLTLAYSGLPFTYPDIIGGLFGSMKFDKEVSPRIRTYMMRNAQWAALHSAMSFGKGPWHFKDPQLMKVVLEAAKLHERLHPYLYSQAVRTSRDGFPWTMTPLPIAFPEDPQVDGRENTRERGYEWMIGDALLAVPLYGNDYDKATTRNVYLPAGEWIEWDSGQRHTGPVMLKDYPLPVGKTPLFVGGTGLVIEKETPDINAKGLVCRAWPVGGAGETVFWDRDGKAQSRIVKKAVNWKSPRVTDKTSGGKVEMKLVGHAWQFPITSGHDYEIE